MNLHLNKEKDSTTVSDQNLSMILKKSILTAIVVVAILSLVGRIATVHSPSEKALAAAEAVESAPDTPEPNDTQEPETTPQEPLIGPEGNEIPKSEWDSLSSSKKTELNPYSCDTSKEWVRGDTGECKDIPVVSKSTSSSTTTVTNNCNREELLKAVGIPSSQWGYVDSVINGEGGWCGVTRWNTTGSGAYGICQALPASKMASAGSDYKTNGLTQLRWCTGYMEDRYGSWQYAAQWKQCVGTCYNSHTGQSTYKNHTWW